MQVTVAASRRHNLSVFGRLAAFVVGAGRAALRGLLVACLLGVVFGLMIGVGGVVFDIHQDQLVVLGGFSGSVAGVIAMVFALLQARRERRVGA